jgi:hypothetical protein
MAVKPNSDQLAGASLRLLLTFWTLAESLTFFCGQWPTKMLSFGSGIVCPARWHAGLDSNLPQINGAITMPKLLLSTNASALAEPVHSLSVEVLTQTSADVKLAPNSDPPSTNPQPSTDEEPLAPDEEERERCVLESRKWDEARKDEQEFYGDFDDIYE